MSKVCRWKSTFPSFTPLVLFKFVFRFKCYVLNYQFVDNLVLDFSFLSSIKVCYIIILCCLLYCFRVSFAKVGNRYVVFQVSRSIGDVYLKKTEFNREPLYQKFRLREPFKRPILSADPSITVHQLLSHDQFIIFASDGLWEHLTNQEAVDIVQNHPRNVRYIYA